MKKIILISLLLGACSTPKLDEPRVTYPLPPAELMQQPKDLKPIEAPKENGKPEIRTEPR